MKPHTAPFVFAGTVVALLLAAAGRAAEPAVPLYGVHELVFTGPTLGPADAPARDVELVTQWRHENSRSVYTIRGFWDGDGQGGASGVVFKVRFCPTQEGKWTLVEVTSNKRELHGQHQGYVVTCTASAQPGFWIVDREQAGGRWYRRSGAWPRWATPTPAPAASASSSTCPRAPVSWRGRDKSTSSGPTGPTDPYR